jgi:hypothetical protein
MRSAKYVRPGIVVMVLMSLLLLDGCNIIRKTVTRKGSMAEGESLVRKVTGSQPDWNFIELRVTGKAEEDKTRFAFMGSVKIHHNSKIFIILRSTLGFEVARFYADMDSVWILSKMLDIKEKGNWKLVGAKVGYPVDFYALQGILVQSLFTSSGDKLENLISGLVVKNETEFIHLITENKSETGDMPLRYLNDFSIDRESNLIEGAKIRDIRGQWIADVRYTYNKDNIIRKIDMKGIDSEHTVSVEMNVVKKEIKEYIEINFDKF